MADLWMISLVDDTCERGDFVAVGLRASDWSAPCRLLDPEFGPPGAAFALVALDDIVRTATYRMSPVQALRDGGVA